MINNMASINNTNHLCARSYYVYLTIFLYVLCSCYIPYYHHHVNVHYVHASSSFSTGITCTNTYHRHTSSSSIATPTFINLVLPPPHYHRHHHRHHHEQRHQRHPLHPHHIFPSKNTFIHQRISLRNQNTNDDNYDNDQLQLVQPSEPAPTKEYFATCIPGLSEILAQELIQIGAQNVRISGPAGVHFTNNNDFEQDVDIGMKALMYVRTAHRIMEHITTSEQSFPGDHNLHLSLFEDDEFDQQSYSISSSPFLINNRESLYNFIQQSLSSTSSQQGLNIQNLLGNGKGGLFTFNISIIMNNSKYIPKDLCHSHYTSLTVKNAIVDMIRDMREDGVRPDVDLVDPDVPFMVVVKGVVTDNKNMNSRNSRNRQNKRGRQSERSKNSHDQQSYYDLEDDSTYYHHDEKSVHVSLYRILHSGGSSLHRRGYRSSSNAIHKAAMKESLAAGLLLQAGWDKLCHAARYQDGQPAVLIDPMCGSGTFCVEAAMIASDYSPGLMRMKCFDNESSKNGNDNYDGGRKSRWNPHQIPPVVRWKNSNKDYWRKLVLEARDRAKSGREWMKEPNSHYSNMSNCLIMGNELNPNALDLAYSNAINAGFNDDHMITLHGGDCVDWEVQESVIPGRTIIACNPPWGLRLNEDIEESWLSLKSFFREQCNESEAWVLSGSKSATRYLRMKKTRSTVIKTADEDLRWIQYHIFKKKEHEEIR